MWARVAEGATTCFMKPEPDLACLPRSFQEKQTYHSLRNTCNALEEEYIIPERKIHRLYLCINSIASSEVGSYMHRGQQETTPVQLARDKV